ncbi:unnamed protein product [Notodromas monacha]|uniref:Ninjurin-2 n=1 Tax=Notodromas monacha TaxID=399045 RepID=A0A7R9BPI8_9CRUS|nr:unnamed protein product [Notodromas monacha]CAG0919053.1 unnamed protein product [Notodromas monacha]
MGGSCSRDTIPPTTGRVGADKKDSMGLAPLHAGGNTTNSAYQPVLNMNRYSSKKSLAQGMLDIALLTANASQLKYVLQYGPKHEFYATLLVMIGVSIFLQGVIAIMTLSLNLAHDCLVERPNFQRTTLAINYINLSLTLTVTFLNIVISALGYTIILGILILLLSSQNINYKENQKAADRMNDMVLALSFVVASLNVVLNSIDLKPIPRNIPP